MAVAKHCTIAVESIVFVLVPEGPCLFDSRRVIWEVHPVDIGVAVAAAAVAVAAPVPVVLWRKTNPRLLIYKLHCSLLAVAPSVVPSVPFSSWDREVVVPTFP